MNDCPREFDCDSCILRGSLDCPAEYNSENEDNLCYDCVYEEQDSNIKPCNTCLIWEEGYLTARNYENKHFRNR